MRSSSSRGQAAVFLDRDGTINVDTGYVHRIEDWEWLPGAVNAIRHLNKLGLPVIVITNQAGVARGHYDEAAISALHTHVDAALARRGARIDAYYYCPHHPEFGPERNCQCRKPRPGMLFRARDQHHLVLERSYMVGDKMSDVLAARAAGVHPLMVMTGYGRQELGPAAPATPIFNNLLAAADFIASDVSTRSPT
jgi:D-glycero-D-manno-heptose 1,7-bisphosphate phosphatase